MVHAHPVALVAFSICRRVPDTALTPQASHVCAEAGFAPYALPGSEQLGRNIADVFGDVQRMGDGVIEELAEAFLRKHP